MHPLLCMCMPPLDHYRRLCCLARGPMCPLRTTLIIIQFTCMRSSHLRTDDCSTSLSLCTRNTLPSRLLRRQSSAPDIASSRCAATSLDGLSGMLMADVRHFQARRVCSQRSQVTRGGRQCLLLPDAGPASSHNRNINGFHFQICIYILSSLLWASDASPASRPAPRCTASSLLSAALARPNDTLARCAYCCVNTMPQVQETVIILLTVSCQRSAHDLSNDSMFCHIADTLLMCSHSLLSPSSLHQQSSRERVHHARSLSIGKCLSIHRRPSLRGST